MTTIDQSSGDSRTKLRRSVYLILIAIGVGMMLGRILAVDRVDMLHEYQSRIAVIPDRLEHRAEQLRARGVSEEKIEEDVRGLEERLCRDACVTRPFLSANDRSRWCMIRALVEPEMRVYEQTEVDGRIVRRWVPYAIDKVVADPLWDTIDKVKHDRQGRGGLGPDEGHLYSSKPPLLPTLIAGEYWLIYHMTGKTLAEEPYAIGRFMLATVNVAPLVVCFLLLAQLIERFGTTDWGRIFVMASAVFGTFLITFAVTLNNHLPGAVSALVALAAAIPIWFDGERRWHYFVLAGMFGAFTVACELPALALAALLALALLWKSPWRTLAFFAPAAAVVAVAFFGTNWIAHGDLKPPYAHRDWTNPEKNWYDYSYRREVQPGREGRVIESYWRSPVGIDQGEKSRAIYAFHCLVGHHGIFSLTPIWLLAFAGLSMWLVAPGDPRLRHLAALIAATTLTCLVFYLFVVGETNYGGMTSGLRWMFWFAPMWLVAMLPAADRMAASRGARAVALALLGLSALSAAYPTWNPWTHPWIYDWFGYLGWL